MTTSKKNTEEQRLRRVIREESQRVLSEIATTKTVDVSSVIADARAAGMRIEDLLDLVEKEWRSVSLAKLASSRDDKYKIAAQKRVAAFEKKNAKVQAALKAVVSPEDWAKFERAWSNVLFNGGYDSKISTFINTLGMKKATKYAEEAGLDIDKLAF